MKKNCIVLIGFRCSGKTSVGREVAKAMGWALLDTDDEVERLAGMSIKEIVQQRGWNTFRDMETWVVRSIRGIRNTVITTGGGVVERGENMEHLKKLGPVIFLEADADTIISRMKSDPKTNNLRPGLTHLRPDEEVKVLLRKRTPLYRRYADITVNTSELSISGAAAKIIEYLRGTDSRDWHGRE